MQGTKLALPFLCFFLTLQSDRQETRKNDECSIFGTTAPLLFRVHTLREHRYMIQVTGRVEVTLAAIFYFSGLPKFHENKRYLREHRYKTGYR